MVPYRAIHVIVASLIYAVICGCTGDVDLRLKPDDPPVTVEKVAVKDCRAVRGFLGTPVDGSVFSWGYRGAICEYPDTGIEEYDAGAGVDYAYNGNDGLHMTLEDESGFDMIVLRGGAKTRLYTNNTELVESVGTQVLHEFDGAAAIQSMRFPSRVVAQKVSFFGVSDGAIADVGFYRIHRDGGEIGDVRLLRLSASQARIPEPTSKFDPESLRFAIEECYKDLPVAIYNMADSAQPGTRISCQAAVPAHFVSMPGGERNGLDAVQLDFVVSDAPDGFAVTTVLHDPIDPRLDLACVDFACTGNGRYRFRLDVPNQVLFENSRIWLTLIFDHDLTLSGPDGDAPLLGIESIPIAQALSEAIDYRKFLLKSFFIILSEARPWGGFRQQSRDEFYAGLPEDRRYGRLIPELFMTIDICHDLAPKDDMVSQYREWVYVRNLDRLSEVKPLPEPPSGAPSWAWYMRLGWLETRRIAKWWLDERLVPTGEFGGMVGDDTDLYQQFVDLPYFENDGVAAQIKDGAARLAEFADKQNLHDGFPILVTDALHAYEDGMNHIALMSRWFYGDPVYYERCLASASSMEKFTVKTPDGRRHIPHTTEIGYQEIVNPRPPTVEGISTPLLWHPTLQAVEYNRNPRALGLLREWADTWLRYQKPGQWATSIDVQTGEVREFNRNNPLSGRAQDLTFAWLYRITGEPKYIEPFLNFYRRGEAPPSSSEFLNDLFNLGALDKIDQTTMQKLGGYNPGLHLLLTGDAEPLIGQMIGSPRSRSSAISNLYDAQRWPDMYTKTQLYVDRIFIGIARCPSIAYLGGYSFRNRYLPCNAVSWEGLGTDYAALVKVNRPDRIEVMVYNFSENPLEGFMRVWTLRHGVYRIEIGSEGYTGFSTDINGETTERELARADGVPVTIAPRKVTVIRVVQTRELDDITARPDLALVEREL